ncbi:MAG TPA: fumarylacetoacetate hydrolase family protein [Candidatus Acidoferrales bacterium]|nr:fumarylacetoacetate hydrolase family protein [Candidatus Acidoferrales bacterium]
MKGYRTRSGIVIETAGSFLGSADSNWDDLVNAEELSEVIRPFTSCAAPSSSDLLAPIGNQEVWAAGVTYFRSRDARIEESKDSGGGDFYAKVYGAERPELFFKAAPYRVVGPGAPVRIRGDSKWNVPEPELTLVINKRGSIVGYTIGNDMSSRDIEGENPLYLPQAKVYDGSCAIGPCVFFSHEPLAQDTEIRISIYRQGSAIFQDSTQIRKIKRSFSDLSHYLYRETSFPYGCLLMTGTGVVPPNDLTLYHGDEIEISIDPVGTLRNIVE